MQRIEQLKKFLLRKETILAVYIIAAIIAAVQLYALGRHFFVMPRAGTYPDDIMNHPENMNQFIGEQLTEYNNYLIFKYSFYHLIHGSNLYAIYHTQHWDFFKYSPTFALFMGSLAWMPDVIGLSIWNILNAITVFFAVRMLPVRERVTAVILWFIALEMLTCLQNTQSNGLMCGLMIAGYACQQRGKTMWATLWLMLATFIKIYGAIGFAIFLFFPGKGKAIAWSIFWGVVLAALPLTVTSLHTLVWQYKCWGHLLKGDAGAAVGLSVAGWLHTWFGIENSKTWVTGLGLLLFLVQFARINMYKNELYRLLVLASTLIWVIIFNHKAESSTFIIALAGVGIWYFIQPQSKWRLAIVIFVFLFTCLGTTDVFPPPVRKGFIYPYTMKAVPCILAWVAVFWQVMTMGKSHNLPENVALRSGYRSK